MCIRDRAKKEAARLAAEEAAAAEAERLRLEEIERKKIAAEDAVFEAEEAARVAAADAKLASQAEAAALVDAAHAEELAHLRRAEREAYEWDRFASCCSRPDPRDPRAMLAYETAARASTDSGLSLGGALDLACEHERIIACLLYTSPSPRDLSTSRMPSSA